MVVITMEEKIEVKRRHARFPAYDDETGVKIYREKRDIFGGGESLITAPPHENRRYENQVRADVVPPLRTESAVRFDEPVRSSEERTYRRHTKGISERAGLSIEQQKEIEKHRANLPDYSKPQYPEKTRTGKTNIFGNRGPGRASYVVRRTHSDPYDASVQMHKDYNFKSSEPTFEPTYVPASVIPDKVENEFTNDELLKAMKKDSQSFLVFDNEPAAYQVKDTEEEPTVRRFGNSEEPTAMTRSEYKKIGKKRNNGEKNKSKSILERSLSGLIEDDTKEADHHSYFPEN